MTVQSGPVSSDTGICALQQESCHLLHIPSYIEPRENGPSKDFYLGDAGPSVAVVAINTDLIDYIQWLTLYV